MAILAAGRKIAPAAILGNLVALGAGLLVMLALGEIALRVVDLGHPYYSAPELYQPSDDPRVLFEPRPSFIGFSEGVDLTTATGLVQWQIDMACGNDETVLPTGLKKPASSPPRSWRCSSRLIRQG